MGDHRRGTELDQDLQPAEVRARPAVRGDCDTDSDVERLTIAEDNTGAYSDPAEVTSNPV